MRLMSSGHGVEGTDSDSNEEQSSILVQSVDSDQICLAEFDWGRFP